MRPRLLHRRQFVLLFIPLLWLWYLHSFLEEQTSLEVSLEESIRPIEITARLNALQTTTATPAILRSIPLNTSSTSATFLSWEDVQNLPLSLLLSTTTTRSNRTIHPTDVVHEQFHQAGITKVDPRVAKLLPTYTEWQDLYGSTSTTISTIINNNNNNNNNTIVLKGWERCHDYRQKVARNDRYVGVAGLFNTGTTALQVYLQANNVAGAHHWTNDASTTTHRNNNKNNNNNNSTVWSVQNDRNHAWEVPWGKHRLYSLREDFRNDDSLHLNPRHVLPVVITREPYQWMQSMCQHSYTARWRHGAGHCPNLVPNSWDVQRFPRLSNQSSIPVVLVHQHKRKFESLAHLYRMWYDEYETSLEPRLLVRLEDLLLFPYEVVTQIQQCVTGDDPNHNKPFVHVAGASKWHHAHHKAQSSRWTALLVAGQPTDYWIRNMTHADVQLAQSQLETWQERMHYKAPVWKE